MIKLKINEKFKALMPKLSADEYSQLEKNIIQNGCLDKIKTWYGFIVDGHNRYSICTKHKIEFDTEEIFEGYPADENEVEEWIIMNQFGRRNLNLFQKSELVIKLKDVYRELAKKNQGKRNDLLQNSAESFTPVDTRQKLADKARVSHTTISTVEEIIKNASAEIIAGCRRGEISIHEASKSYKKKEPDKPKPKPKPEPKPAFGPELEPEADPEPTATDESEPEKETEDAEPDESEPDAEEEQPAEESDVELEEVEDDEDVEEDEPEEEEPGDAEPEDVKPVNKNAPRLGGYLVKTLLINFENAAPTIKINDGAPAKVTGKKDIGTFKALVDRLINEYHLY